MLIARRFVWPILGVLFLSGAAAMHLVNFESQAPMIKYRVVLNGQNFLLKSDGKLSRHGFFTTRFVEAVSPKDAEVSAVDLIRNDPELKAAVLNDSSTPPRIYLEELAELESFDGVAVPGTGYTFYVEEGQ